MLACGSYIRFRSSSPSPPPRPSPCPLDIHPGIQASPFLSPSPLPPPSSPFRRTRRTLIRAERIREIDPEGDEIRSRGSRYQHNPRRGGGWCVQRTGIGDKHRIVTEERGGPLVSRQRSSITRRNRRQDARSMCVLLCSGPQTADTNRRLRGKHSEYIGRPASSSNPLHRGRGGGERVAGSTWLNGLRIFSLREDRERSGCTLSSYCSRVCWVGTAFV